MSTGTVQSAPFDAIINQVGDGYLQIGFTNDSGGALVEGQEVIIKSNGKLDKRDADGEFPIGIVYKGGANGARVGVKVRAGAQLNVVIKGGAATPGQFVRNNGNVDATTGLAEVVASPVNAYSGFIVIEGAAQDGVAKVLFLPATRGGAGSFLVQTLAAYTADNEGTPYSSVPGALGDAATLVDVNALRAAVENLRVSYEDLRTKLIATGVVTA